MSKMRNILYRIYSPIVKANPDLFLSILKRNHREMLVSRMEIGLSDEFEVQRLPLELRGFEDLSFLFWSTPVNRGMIRQDLDEASALYKRISAMENPTGIEIGIFSGGSTILLAAAVGEAGKLISIDICPKDDAFLAGILSKYGLLGRVHLIENDANTVMLEDHRLFDFVFIDGDHSYEGAKLDHNKWGARVKQYGLIIHHDMGLGRPYATQHSQLLRLKNDILKTQADELQLLAEVGSMCFFRRISSTWTPV